MKTPKHTITSQCKCVLRGGLHRLRFPILHETDRTTFQLGVVRSSSEPWRIHVYRYLSITFAFYILYVTSSPGLKHSLSGRQSLSCHPARSRPMSSPCGDSKVEINAVMMRGFLIGHVISICATLGCTAFNSCISFDTAQLGLARSQAEIVASMVIVSFSLSLSVATFIIFHALVHILLFQSLF